MEVIGKCGRLELLFEMLLLVFRLGVFLHQWFRSDKVLRKDRIEILGDCNDRQLLVEILDLLDHVSLDVLHTLQVELH